MKTVEGPRPWPIRLFAVLFLAAALIRLVAGLIDPTPMIADLVRWFPGQIITWDMAIVALSAEFTIACIPVALVWLRGVRIARVLVGVMAGVRVITFDPAPRMAGVPVDQLALLLSVAAAVLLFTPQANRWFTPKDRSDAEHFH